MSPYIPFISNFVKSEWTLAVLDKLPLATSQPFDFFSPKLLDCLSIWSTKVRGKKKKTSSTKIVLKAPMITFFLFGTAGG